MHTITEPHISGMLPVSDIHHLYYEVSGNPKGKPVVFLHGGPGGGTVPAQRGFFDPQKYRIVLFDQRGCGRSLPYACIEDNTTWDLVEDIEKLRVFLGIERWQVFGGSWGSTLALAYAQSHPERVTELVLRGIFLSRRHEIDWLTQGGADRIFPEYWADFLAPLTADEYGDTVAAYRRLLSPDNPDPAQMLAAASAWAQWEAHLIYLIHNTEAVAHYHDGEAALAIARIENHYFSHLSWLTAERALLANIDQIRHIPTVIVQGRYDICTPPQSAWDLYQAFPEARLEMVLAGHSAFDSEIARALVAATDRFAS
ncbi:proline iminopeptidase [Neisseria sp. HSC-16F19]|nr:prolyl aminopeptidase [Neisseria sp. HSC-16F19]MCP2041339.1 proline iminopeptidase [Neisseria sp. HSC-16F19]